MTPPSPMTLVDVAHRVQVGSSLNRIIGPFLDAFYRNPSDRQAMIFQAPAITKQEQVDAYLAAVAEHLARTYGLDIPKWTQDCKRFLNKPWFTEGGSMANSPLAFRKRMIYVTAEPLKRKGMPPA